MRWSSSAVEETPLSRTNRAIGVVERRIDAEELERWEITAPGRRRWRVTGVGMTRPVGAVRDCPAGETRLQAPGDVVAQVHRLADAQHRDLRRGGSRGRVASEVAEELAQLRLQRRGIAVPAVDHDQEVGLPRRDPSPAGVVEVPRQSRRGERLVGERSERSTGVPSAQRNATGTRSDWQMSSISPAYISAWELPSRTTRGVAGTPRVDDARRCARSRRVASGRRGRSTSANRRPSDGGVVEIADVVAQPRKAGRSKCAWGRRPDGAWRRPDRARRNRESRRRSRQSCVPDRGCDGAAAARRRRCARESQGNAGHDAHHAVDRNERPVSVA